MKNVFALLVITLLFGCGGGGGGDSTPAEPATPTGTTFDLTKVLSLTPGDSFSFSLTGTDTGGGTFTGTLQSVNRAKITLGGQLVTPRESILNLTNTTTSAFVSGVGTSYYNAAREPVEMQTSDGVTWTPTTVVAMPTTAQIGDFGSSSSFRDAINETVSTLWRLEAATGGAAYLTLSSVFRDAGGTVYLTEDDVYTLASNGIPTALSVRAYYVNQGITINLSGTPQ